MRNIIVLVFFISNQIFAQKAIDKIEAIIGDEILLSSDIETQYQQYLAQGYTNRELIRCSVVEDLLYQKILIHQAKLDSLEISDKEIDSELDKRIRYFVSQIGSKEKLEEFYGKSIIEIKTEFRTLIKEQLLSQRMQGDITAGVKVTPFEVKEYFKNLSKDSLPIIEAEVEIAQIVLKPKISDEEKERVINNLNTFKERVQKGEDFKVLATLYSDDPVSAKNGGELGFVGRGNLVPVFESAAYKLKGDELSNVIESEFGYHIIQLIERRGEQINVRHILLKPKVSSVQLLAVKIKMDSISELINQDKITFEEAVLKFSDDESRNNEGLLINPASGSSMFVMQDLDRSLYFIIEKMEEGEISAPFTMESLEGSQAYSLLKLRKNTRAHTANLTDDYDKIQNAALAEKKQVTIDKWLKEKIIKNYIKIGNNLKDCKFEHQWVIN